MDILRFVFLHLAISVPFLIFGIVVDLWLCRIGVIRGNKVAVVIGTVIVIFLKPILFESLSWTIYGPIILLGLVLTVHRSDLTETIRHGRWWWEKKRNKHQRR